VLPDIALIVEDQVITALDLKSILRSCGCCNSLIVNKGAKAIEYIETKVISLGLLDINLADDVTGIEVARRLEQKNIPFIFVSAFANPENRRKAKELNPLAIVEKPIDGNYLKSIINSFINSSNQASFKIS